MIQRWIDAIRRNHGLEHATVAVMIARHGPRMLAGRASSDGFYILGGVDDGEILKLVRRRQIDLILICEHSADDGYFLMGGGDGILYKRLERGEFPEWIVEVGLPRDLRQGFRLFEVVLSR